MQEDEQAGRDQIQTGRNKQQDTTHEETGTREGDPRKYSDKEQASRTATYSPWLII